MNALLSSRKSLDFIVSGGHTLSGTVATNSSKNGAMGLMCAALLNRGKTTLKNMPRIEEVNRILEVLASIGVHTEWINGGKDLSIIRPEQFDMAGMDVEAAGRTRSILMFMGPLLHEFKSFDIPHDQGCRLGKRSAAAHIYALEELGAKITVKSDKYVISHTTLKGAHITMFETGDTPTENVLLAAAKIPGKTTVHFASPNYMVQDVCFFLQRCGVHIEGVGTTSLTIHGVVDINQDIEHYISEDPIESMMFLSAAITTDSSITIQRCPIEFLELELYKLKKMGFKYKKSREYKSYNGITRLVDITTYPSRLKALPEHIEARPFPGINIDNLPFFLPIVAKAKGESLIHDWVYENRAIYYMDLAKLGVDMILADPHRVYVTGPTKKFKAVEIACPPALRPAMIILIVMLAAPGTSILRNVYSINRGYEEIASRLNSLGAQITVLSENN
jgi:UDP-N-acetylglucosamine 1-carboxyvinyltransferase